MKSAAAGVRNIFVARFHKVADEAIIREDDGGHLGEELFARVACDVLFVLEETRDH